MTEIWKDIPGHEGRYQASSLGRIRSLDYTRKHWRSGTDCQRKGRVLHQSLNHCGYYITAIGGKTSIVSRAVCAAFHGPCPEGMECMHANDIRTDNRPGNLSWGTYAENHAQKDARNLTKGDKHYRAVLTTFQAYMIKSAPKGQISYQKLADMLGVSKYAINSIRIGKTWAWL